MRNDRIKRQEFLLRSSFRDRLIGFLRWLRIWRVLSVETLLLYTTAQVNRIFLQHRELCSLIKHCKFYLPASATTLNISQKYVCILTLHLLTLFFLREMLTKALDLPTGGCGKFCSYQLRSVKQRPVRSLWLIYRPQVKGKI